MKFLLVLFLVFAVALSYDCPHDQEVKCIDDINKAYPVCQKASQEKGKDVPVDLDCMKYFAQMGSECWGCICWVAQINKWKIKGC